MKILEQIAAIFAIYLISLGIVEVLPFTIPVSITSMIVLFILLFFKLIKEKQIQETADFLLKNMAFFLFQQEWASWNISIS